MERAVVQREISSMLLSRLNTTGQSPGVWIARRDSVADAEQVLRALTVPELIARWAPVGFEVAGLAGGRLRAGPAVLGPRTRGRAKCSHQAVGSEELPRHRRRILLVEIDGGVHDAQGLRAQLRAHSVDRLRERRPLAGEDLAADGERDVLK